VTHEVAIILEAACTYSAPGLEADLAYTSSGWRGNSELLRLAAWRTAIAMIAACAPFAGNKSSRHLPCGVKKIQSGDALKFAVKGNQAGVDS